MVFPLVLVLGAAWLASAQPAEAPRTCAALLTPEEIKAAAIPGLEDPDEPAVQVYQPGRTECVWQGTDVTVSYQLITTKVLEDDRESPAERFRSDVQAVESDDHKREAIPGVGLDAALVPLGDGATLVAVRLRDGVVRMILSGVSKDGAIALAKAIAVP